ncbi:uncharacterized protein LOC125494008 [Beta vulgaris subsp. vulgaris]|uniref:uncharacterized protein LOC125494008 n=1 Tax=Beta vulgaris subsp. vulgaris TaxID=3555 RepID=UPI002036CEDC|nr:uncharacterized protein LOC125494008 [Beta vulgaris subsp. vulgaris]
MGLNVGYEQMKSNLLGMDPLLPVNKAYNLVLKVEKHKQITGEMSIGNEMSVLNVNWQVEYLGPLKDFQRKDYKRMKMEKDAKKCDYCGMKGHLKVECFNLNGYPERFKNAKPRNFQRQAANVVKEETERETRTPFEGSSFQEENNEMKDDGKMISAVVQEVMEALGKNAIAYSNFADNKVMKFMFDKNGCYVQDLTNEQIIAHGRNHHDLYVLDVKKKEAKKDLCARRAGKLLAAGAMKDNDKNLSLLHARLGHVSLSKIKHLKFCDCKGLNNYFCDTCSVSKHHKLPFMPSSSIAENIFDMIHVDLWGLYSVKVVTGASYFLTIVDYHSRVTWTHLMSNKEQVKTIRFDNGTEIFQQECGKILAEKGIVHQSSVVRRPQQNGRVERKHRFLLETGRALKIHANLPDHLWGECILTATYLINLLPSSVLNWETPYKRLMKKDAQYGHLRDKRDHVDFINRFMNAADEDYASEGVEETTLDIHPREEEEELMQPEVIENDALDQQVYQQQSHTIAERARPARQRTLPEKFKDYYVVNLPDIHGS